jgi:hypothetical protein
MTKQIIAGTVTVKVTDNAPITHKVVIDNKTKEITRCNGELPIKLRRSQITTVVYKIAGCTHEDVVFFCKDGRTFCNRRPEHIVKIHVNQIHIRQNNHLPINQHKHVFTVKVKHGLNIYCKEVLIHGPSKVVYDPANRLSCGATAWIEANYSDLELIKSMTYKDVQTCRK